MNNAQLGFVRGLAFTVILAVLSYLGDASHLNGIVSVGVAGIISSLALSLEHYVEGRTGNGLFGAVSVRR